MLRKSVVILAMLLSGMATQVLALGLGTVTVESALNQPLRVRIEILQLGDTRLEDVNIQLASLDDFQRFNIDRAGFLSNIRFAVEATPQGNYVVLTTNQIVREPYLSFILETRWPSGRLLSEHTILLDLPVFSDEQSQEPVRQPISPVLQQPGGGAEPQPEPAQPRAPAAEPPVVRPPQPAPAPTEALPELSAEDAPEEQSENMPATAETGTGSAEEAEPESDPQQAARPEVEPQPEVADTAGAADEQVEQPAAQPEEAVAAADEPVSEPEPEAEPDASAAVVADAAPEPTEAEPAMLTTDSNDTLTEIALQVRPDNSVSVQQTMVAIQQLNPDAFTDNNINRMRSGQVLRVPTLAEIENVGAQQAVAEVTRQNQEFADTQPLAAPSNNQPDADDDPQGQLSVVADDQADDDAAIDASSGAGQAADSEFAELDQRIAELENQLAQQQEEADRARIEREQLDSQLAELEEQIAAAQEIIRLQDLQLAQLQESLAQAAAEAEAEARALAAQQAAIAAAEQDSLAARPSGGLVNDLMRVLTGNIMMMVFGALLIILLLVMLLLRRNRANKLAVAGDELDELAEQEFDAAAREQVAEKTRAETSGDLDSDALDAELDDIIDRTPAEEGDLDELDPGDAGDDEVSEPAAEDDLAARAEHLVQDGHLDRAENLLQEALLDDGDDDKLRLKLAEVLARKGDLAAFEEQADLIAQAQSPILDREVDNYRKLFAVQPPSSDDEDVAPPEASSEPATEESKTAQQEADEESSFLDDLGIDLDSFDDDSFEFSDDIETPAEDKPKESAGEPGKAASQKPDSDDLDDDDMDLTFELGGGDDDAHTAGDGDEEAPAAESASESPLVEVGDDADPDGNKDAGKHEPGAPTGSGGDDDSTADEMPGLDLEDSDDKAELAAGDSKDPGDVEIESFEFDTDSFAAEPAGEPEKANADDNLDLETFAFDTDDLGLDKEPEPEPEAAAEDDDNAVEFSFNKEELEDNKPEDENVEDLETFDFDLEDTVVEKPTPEQPATDDGADAHDSGGDFDFDLDEFDIGDETGSDAPSGEGSKEGESGQDPETEPETEPEKEPEIESEETPASDEVEIDLDDDEEPEPADDSDDDDLEDLEFLSDDDDVEIESVGDVEEFDMLSDVDEAATKLELAYAYQKMGDAEGAREILQEVIKEGNEEQVKEAEKLLAALDDQG